MVKLSKRARRLGILAILGIAAILISSFLDISSRTRESVRFAVLLGVVVAGAAMKDEADS